MLEYDFKTARILRHYESVSFIQKKYLSKHSLSSVSKDKVLSIVLNMKQGKALFKSALVSDYLSKPVEQYYGILAYARAMIMFLNPNIAEKDLKQSHGLQIISLPTQIANAKEMLDIKIKINGGFFSQWVKENNQSFVMRNKTAAPSFPYEFDKNLKDSKYSLFQLLSLLPDLWEELKQHTSNAYIRLQFSSLKDNQVVVKTVDIHDNDLVRKYIARCFSITETKITQLNDNEWGISFTDKELELPQLVQSFHGFLNFGIGDIFIVPKINSKTLNPMAIMIIISYVMSMLARYRPSIWGKIWQNYDDIDALFPLIEQTMNYLQQYFPTLLVDNLEKDQGKNRI